MGRLMPVFSATMDRVAAARVGSHYFIYENQEAVVVMTDRKWKPLATMGFDND